MRLLCFFLLAGAFASRYYLDESRENRRVVGGRPPVGGYKRHFFPGSKNLFKRKRGVFSRPLRLWPKKDSYE